MPFDPSKLQQTKTGFDPSKLESLKSSDLSRPRDAEQGFFKNYPKGAKTYPQEADVAAGQASSFLLKMFNAPYEAATAPIEAITAKMEGRPAETLSIFGGQPSNPISTVNKLLRAGAGAISQLRPGGTPLNTARDAYNAPRGSMGSAEDFLGTVLLGGAAPEAMAAPMDTAIAGTSQAIKTGAKVAGWAGKKAITTAFGVPEEAQSLLINRRPDVVRQTNYNDLADRMAETTNKLSDKVTELDNAAWNTLPVDATVPKAKIISILQNVRQKFVGEGGTKIGSSDAQAVKQIDSYIEKVKGITQEAPPPEPPGLLSAIKLRGKTYVGKPGEIHIQVIDRIAKELKQDPNTVIDSVNKIGDMGFSQGGKFLTRSEVKDQFGGARPEAASLIGQRIMQPSPIKGGLGEAQAAAQAKAASENISHPQLKDIVQSIRKDATYGLNENPSINRATKEIGSEVDQYLKSENPAYKDAMVPVAEATAALKDTVSRFGLKRDPNGGYAPEAATITRLKALPTEKNPGLTRAIESLKNTTGVDFADEAKLTAAKMAFDARANPNGFRRTGGGTILGGLVGHGLGDTRLGTEIGLPLGMAADYYGGPMAKAVLAVPSVLKTGTGGVLSAINSRIQGTPYQQIISNMLNQRPVLLPQSSYATMADKMRNLFQGANQ